MSKSQPFFTKKGLSQDKGSFYRLKHIFFIFLNKN